jgi:hypothetical protein
MGIDIHTFMEEYFGAFSMLFLLILGAYLIKMVIILNKRLKIITMYGGKDGFKLEEYER